MGFVANPGLGHEAISLGAQALARLAHRGGLDADGKSGDGAGLLIQVPQRLRGGEVAVAVLFEWDKRAREIIADAVASLGLELVSWRAVPVDPRSLGDRALALAAAMLGDWENVLRKFRQLVPVAAVQAPAAPEPAATENRTRAPRTA